MLRAARFAAQLGFVVAPEVVAAMTGMAERIEIISAERIRDELVKLISAPYPRRGLALLVETGLAAHVLPELPALALERDEHHRHKDVYEHTLTVLEQSIDLEDRLPGGGPDFVSRFAALMHDVGKPRTRKFLDDGSVTFHHHDVVGAKITRKRMQALRFSKDEIDAVAKLVELHLRFHGYGSGEWTDSAVRRYVRDAGDQLERLHVLTRADCTTRNRAKAERLRRTYDDLETRIARLREQEELDAIRPDLDGNQIMELLGIPPGRDVGAAYQYLLELRLDHGPMSEDAAKAALLEWWGSRSMPVEMGIGWSPGRWVNQNPDLDDPGGPAGCRGSRWADPAASAGAGGRPARRPESSAAEHAVRRRGRGARPPRSADRRGGNGRPGRGRPGAGSQSRWPAPANSPTTPRLTSRRSGMPTNPPSRSRTSRLTIGSAHPTSGPRARRKSTSGRDLACSLAYGSTRSRRRTSRYQYRAQR